MVLPHFHRRTLVVATACVALLVAAVAVVPPRRLAVDVAVGVGSPCGPSLISNSGDLERLTLPDGACQWRPAPLSGLPLESRKQCCCRFTPRSEPTGRRGLAGRNNPEGEDTQHGARKRKRGVMYRCLPHALVIGAQKSGTTALFGYMLSHPNVTTPNKKELHFFDRLTPPPPRSSLASSPNPAPRRRRRQTIANYLLGMGSPRSTPRFTVAAEATPSYVLGTRTPEFVRAVLPDARLILILRDPVLRLVSEYKMKQRRIASQLHPSQYTDVIDRVFHNCTARPHQAAQPTVDCLFSNWAEDVPGFQKQVLSRLRNRKALQACLVPLVRRHPASADHDADVGRSRRPRAKTPMDCFKAGVLRYEKVAPLAEAIKAEAALVEQCERSRSDAHNASVQLADGRRVPAPLLNWGERGCWPVGTTSDISKDFIVRGMYYAQIVQWLKVFPRSQLLILDQRELLADPTSTMERVWGFLGLPQFDVSSTAPRLEDVLKATFPSFVAGTGWAMHSDTKVSLLPDSSRNLLAGLYQRHNQQLEEFLHISLNWTAPAAGR